MIQKNQMPPRKHSQGDLSHKEDIGLQGKNKPKRCTTFSFGDEPHLMLKVIQRFGKYCGYHLQDARSAKRRPLL
jgi:hypothetical protein